MKVKAVKLDETGRKPEEVTVVMQANEALYMALVTGKQTLATSEEIISGGSELNFEIYDCLTGDLFNRFFAGGTGEAKNVY